MGLISSCIKNPIKEAFHKDPDPKVFSCKINGNTYVPYNGSIIFSPVSAIVSYNKFNFTYTIRISTSLKVNNSLTKHLDMTINNVTTGEGVYLFNKDNRAIYSDSKYYTTDMAGHGSVTITHFHPASTYMTGTFKFNAPDIQNPTDSIRVTGGHFNISDLNKQY